MAKIAHPPMRKFGTDRIHIFDYLSYVCYLTCHTCVFPTCHAHVLSGSSGGNDNKVVGL